MPSASWAVRCEGLGKQYRLGESAGRPRSLYETLSDGLALLKGRHASQRGELFWALRGVDFDIGQGEVVGVVGRNGAGKSTLLKILSRITTPTEGRVLLRGKLASLLEVGTGFHPELTGRENIFLNGTILGMRRREIEKKFDEIVAFAELDRFLDTPVKRYSSGMYVRLAFAVAAHLDADILVIDEVLAVGDAAFQRKSLGKMGEVASSGRTVLFVSHNLGAVRALCSTVLLLNSGQVAFRGPTEDGVARYEAEVGSDRSVTLASFQGSLVGEVLFEEVEIRQGSGRAELLDPEQAIEIVVRGESRRDFEALELNLGLFRDGFRLLSCHDAPRGTAMRAGPFASRFRLPAGLLRPGRYVLGLGAYRPDMSESLWSSEVTAMSVSEKWGARVQGRDSGAVSVDYESERSQ